MSTVTLELEEVLNRLDASKRAELEEGVRRMLDQIPPPAQATGAVLAKWRGAFPDFPEDIPDMDHERTFEDPFALAEEE